MSTLGLTADATFLYSHFATVQAIQAVIPQTPPKPLPGLTVDASIAVVDASGFGDRYQRPKADAGVGQSEFRFWPKAEVPESLTTKGLVLFSKYRNERPCEVECIRADQHVDFSEQLIVLIGLLLASCQSRRPVRVGPRRSSHAVGWTNALAKLVA